MIDPIFVVGVPRSGTTLLQSMLSAHPTTYSLPETHFFVHVLPQISRRIDEKLSESETIEALLILQNKMAFNLDEMKIDDLRGLARTNKLTALDLFEFVVEQYRPEDVDQSLRVIEKTPLHVLHMDEILSIYGDSKFIHILRDPLATISSVLQTPFCETDWLPWHIHRWNLVVETARAFSEKHPGALLTIRYEDLVTNPRNTLELVCRFLEIKFSPRMVSDFAGAWERNIVPSETWKHRNEKVIKSDPEIWNERISIKEAWFIEHGTRFYGTRYQYNHHIRLSSQKKMQVWIDYWLRLRQDRTARGWCLTLIKNDLELGRYKVAERLALRLLLTDWRNIRNPVVRQTLFRKN